MHTATPGGAPPDPPAGPPLMRLRDLLGAWDAEADALYQAKQSGKARGPVTGLPKLDRELSGALAPGVHILHGNTGAGKTAFALQVAAGCGCPCLYVTCEMAPLELLRRLTARATGTFLGRFKTGELHPSEAKRLVRQAVAELPHLVLMDGTQVYPAPAAIQTAADATRQTIPDSAHLLIVVDSVHSWAEGVAGEEYDAVNFHLAALRKLAARLSCPVLGIAERNRQSIGKGGANAAAGSRKFEYGAETVFDLAADPDAKEDANGDRPVTLKLVKNRNGAPGKPVEMLFRGALQSFQEV